jgi:hypothetical protein
MNAQTWLKDFKEAETNRSNSHLFHFELLLLAVFSGYWYQSWTLGIVVFFILLAISGVKFLAKIMMILLTLLWLGLTYFLCDIAELSNEPKYIILSLVFIFNLGLHSAALKWLHPTEIEGKDGS